MLQKIRKAKKAGDCWDIVVSARKDSKEEAMALRKYLKLTSHIQSLLNIYCNFFSVRNEAKRRILHFATSFRRCMAILQRAEYVPELKFTLLYKALDLAGSIREYEKLLKYFREDSEGAYICRERISELQALKQAA